ncbi:Holliday junction resolvase RuvX [Actinotalea ferrariae]|uniref:Holliday junction resolvase RuvX n=1 Tax=Actinotalea ferrariae TaxID=1386098 RepID=UPI001C8C3C36|nr:Holliday junction resolvase RuvX [Actinotalea ferrariae]MBX9246615.1 Holliday junction resolvase RuvX [Actinotalea ferrariae]
MGAEPTSAGEALPRGARLAVDVGAVRVGLAASDPDGLIATPVETVPRDAAPGIAGPSDVARIAAVADERSAAVVYVGLPRSMSGAEGSASALVRTYCVALAHAVAPVPVRLVDERLSTVTAHQALHASGRAGRRHRAVVDQAAAVVILQAALDAEKASGRRAGELVGPAQARDDA